MKIILIYLFIVIYLHALIASKLVALCLNVEIRYAGVVTSAANFYHLVMPTSFYFNSLNNNTMFNYSV